MKDQTGEAVATALEECQQALIRLQRATGASHLSAVCIKQNSDELNERVGTSITITTKAGSITWIK